MDTACGFGGIAARLRRTRSNSALSASGSLKLAGLSFVIQTLLPVQADEAGLSDLEEMGDEALRLFSDIVHWKAYDLGCETPKKIEKVLRKISVRLP